MLNAATKMMMDNGDPSGAVEATEREAVAPLVMIIEDNDDLRQSLEEYLELKGYQVIGATDGRQGLEFLSSSAHPPALILLDLMMPGMDGWEFRGVMLQDPKLRDVPTVLISAVAALDEEAAMLRASGYLRKPFQPNDVLDVVREHAGQAPDRGPGA